MDQETKSIVLSELERVKHLPIEALLDFGKIGVTTRVQCGSGSCDVTIWSVPAHGNREGAIAVLAGTWTSPLLGISRHYFSGFIVEQAGSISDIPEPDLWRYD